MATVPKEDVMARKSIDCRDYPSEKNCTVEISANTDEELLDASILHGVTVHGMKDTPELREQLVKGFKEV